MHKGGPALAAGWLFVLDFDNLSIATGCKSWAPTRRITVQPLAQAAGRMWSQTIPKSESTRGKACFLRPLAVIVTVGTLAAGAAWWYQTTRPAYRLRRGQEALHRGRPDIADRLAEQLEADGHYDHARLLRGEALLHDHQFARAIQEFNRIQDRGDLYVEASAIYGVALLSVKRSFEAEQLLRYVVSERPDYLEAQRGLAAIYFDQGALTLAVRHAKECARLEPHKGYPFWFMGVIFEDLGQYAAARDAFQQALERGLSDKQRTDVREGLAEVLVQLKDYAKALAILEECPPAVNDKPKILACRAECLWGLERATEGKALLDRALQKHPQSPDLLRLRARLYLNDSEPHNAAALLERALQVDRHDHQSRYELVQAYQMLGRRTEAAEQQRLLKQTQDYLAELTSLNHEIAERPWDAAVRTRLAEVCDKLDKPDLAAMWRQAAAAGLSARLGE
jgi:tetratricopeptide (TPR) repeat protein